MKTIQSELFDFTKSGVGKEVPIIQTGSTNWEALFTIVSVRTLDLAEFG